MLRDIQSMTRTAARRHLLPLHCYHDGLLRLSTHFKELWAFVIWRWGEKKKPNPKQTQPLARSSLHTEWPLGGAVSEGEHLILSTWRCRAAVLGRSHFWSCLLFIFTFRRSQKPLEAPGLVSQGWAPSPVSEQHLTSQIFKARGNQGPKPRTRESDESEVNLVQ